MTSRTFFTRDLHTVQSLDKSIWSPHIWLYPKFRCNKAIGQSLVALGGWLLKSVGLKIKKSGRREETTGGGGREDGRTGGLEDWRIGGQDDGRMGGLGLGGGGGGR